MNFTIGKQTRELTDSEIALVQGDDPESILFSLLSAKLDDFLTYQKALILEEKMRKFQQLTSEQMNTILDTALTAMQEAQPDIQNLQQGE